MAGTLQVGDLNLTPSSKKVALPTNYLSSNSFNFLNQYLPDTYEPEFNRFGNRSIAGWLRHISAEIPSASDLIKWSEQGRLHTKYTALTFGAISSGTQVFTLASGSCVFRVGQTVFLSSEQSASESAKGVVTAVAANGTTFTVTYYKTAYQSTSPFTGATTSVSAFVYGSEFQKGTAGMQGSLEAENEIFEVSPIIIKDKYVVAGSDMAQIGWIEIDTEDGTGGYMWYLKSNSETRMRFEDYLEMAMVEGQVGTSAAIAAAGLKGTNGFFEGVEDRGNIWSGGNPSSLVDMDYIIQLMDKNGAIEQNAIFADRRFNLDLDDILAAQNSYGTGGTSYGMFDNDEEMALNLGFRGFRRGSYDFYKSDWKYLNDASLRGGIVGGKVSGVLVPVGTTSVYDQVLGQNARRPFLHVRYRETEKESRKYKTWITGSAGGAETSDLDAMEVNYLSERALCTLGANNFVLFKG